MSTCRLASYAGIAGLILVGGCSGGSRSPSNALVRSSTTTPTPAAVAPSAPAPADASTPPPGAATDSLAGAFAALDCSQAANRQGNGSVDKPTDETVACDRDGKAKYLLAPATVVGTDVKGATARLDPAGTNQWQVGVTFTGGGQKKFTDLTAATVGKQVAIVLDGVVISAPVIQNTIPGDAQITGNFSKDEAQNLANVLEYGALPLTFTENVLATATGTTVTLSPLASMGTPSAAAVEQALSILQQRTRGLGLSSATVAHKEDQIVIVVPRGVPDEVLRLLGATAELRFREVVQETPSGAGAPAAPAPVPAPSRRG